ncbi:MAG: hypothetical protein IKN85_14980, partial [Oscillospiraceae bacterium]|nr:hypothetical protein [Oscillospiraceae bacterium]
GVKNIYFGDVNHTITDVKSYLKDGVHPNDTGYKQMGIYWAGVIKEYLGNRTPSPEPSFTTAEPAVTLQPSVTTLPEAATTEPSVTTETAVTTESDHPGPKLAEPFPGDVNLDGTLNTADFTAMINLLTGKEHVSTDRISCDLNSDGKLNIADLILLKEMLIK